MEDTLSATLDLLRRLPPQNIDQNLELLCQLLPELTDDLLSTVDAPLKSSTDSTGREYLVCDYNRDGDSHRSPWTNTYDPPLPDGTTPSDAIRKLEVAMNEAFATYLALYFESGISSVYLWDLDEGFAGVVLLKKVTDTGGTRASWDSVHVFESHPSPRARTAHYKLTSTIMLHLSSSAAASGSKVELGGSMTRQTEVDAPLVVADGEAAHVVNIGKTIEDLEIKMRNSISEVYFSKTKDIISNLRSSSGFGEENKRLKLQGELVGLLRGRATA